MTEREVIKTEELKTENEANSLFADTPGDKNEISKHKSPEELFEELVLVMQKYYSEEDISLIKKAYELAYNAHIDQKRKSGEPYIVHPLSVAIILANLELDKESVAAGLLHDVIEDTIVTYDEVEREFGKEVAVIVDGVTKLGKLNYSSDKLEEQAENLRKMFLAMAKDIRVIMVKLADRLHNMRTLKYMKPEKQRYKAKETMDIYAPIAQRLGISKIKIELDDLALKYTEPEAYYKLVHEINEKKTERQKFVDNIVNAVSKNMREADIKAAVTGRAKHFFSIYKKMLNKDKMLDQIYDMFAVRIIVDSVKDCYTALGVIHELYTPIPGRFKDYIAMPKENMYQSLHTTVIGKSGRPFEIQIRTADMHRIAEFGIAAHWKYKEGGLNNVKGGEEEKLNWLRQILEWQQDMSDNKEFLSLLKSDLNLFNDNVYCFSPAGDVKTLPTGSCPIDFAYAVHSAVGNTMVGARINDKLVPIETKLNNGDIVEIITSQNSRGPSRDWIKVVKSTQAKNRINQWFRREFKEENIIKGKDMLASYAKSKGKELSRYLKPEYMEVVMRKYGFKDWEAVLAAMGHGGLREGQVLNKLIDAYSADEIKRLTDENVLEAVAENAAAHSERHTSKGGILVNGLSDVSVRMSKCCGPIPGDEIVGYVTRGRGVTIHRTDCINIINLPDFERERLIDAEWMQGSDKNQKYLIEINIYATNRPGRLEDISNIFTEKKIYVLAMNVRVSKQGVATFACGFQVNNREELSYLSDKIRQVPNVIDIERAKG